MNQQQFDSSSMLADHYAAERAKAEAARVKAQASFIEDCKTARVVKTASGDALLIGDTVVSVSAYVGIAHFLCAALNALAPPSDLTATEINARSAGVEP